MVGRAPTVLSSRAGVAAFVAVGAAVGTYYAVRTELPDLSLWWDVLVLSVGVIPGVLALALLALPVERANGWLLLGGAVISIVLAIVLHHEHYELAGNWAKFWAPVLLGFLFIRAFEEDWWIVPIAIAIAAADSFSVFSNVGPTHQITEHHAKVYFNVAFGLYVPGNGAAWVGPPDLLFFALFLAACVRFRLRLVPTWFVMTASFALQLVISVAAGIDGLPALPFLSASFLLVNGDLLWQRWQARPRPNQTGPGV